MSRTRRLLLLAAALLLLALAVAAVLVGTRWGLQRIVSLADGVAGTRIEAEVRDGSLLGGFTLAAIDVDAGGTRIRLDRLAVAWRPSGLLGGELTLDAIEAGALRIDPAEADREPGGDVPPTPPALPVDVVIGSFRLASLTLGDAPEPVLRDLVLAGSLRDERLTLETLGAELAPGRLDAEGEIRLAPPWSHQLSARFAGAPGQRVADLEVELAGDAESTRLTARSEELATDLQATATDLAGTPAWEARLTLARGALAPWPESARIEASGSLDSARLSGQLVVDGRRIELRELAVSRDGDAARIELFRAAVPADGLAVSASGRVDPTPAGQLSGTVRLERDGLGGTVDFEVAGGPDAFDGRVEGTVDGPLGPVPARVVFAGTPERLDLTEGTLRLGDGTLRAAGTVTFGDAVAWSATLRADGIDPARFAPELPGHVSFALVGSGSGDRWRAELDDVSGTLRGRELAGGGRLAGRGARIDDADLTLRSGQALLRAVGRWVGEFPVGEASLEVPELADLLPDAGGSLTMAAVATPEGVNVSASASAVTLPAVAIHATEVTARVDPRSLSTSTATLRVESLEASGVVVDEATVELSGWRDDARAVFDVVLAELGTVTGEAAYESVDGTDRLRLADLALDVTRVGTWTLEAPFVLERRGAAIRADRGCLASDAGRLCVEAKLVPGEAGTVAVDLAAVPLDLFEPAVAAAIGEPLKLTGTLAGELRGRTSGLSWSGVSARLTGEAITVSAPHRLADRSLSIERLLTSVEGDASSLAFSLTGETSAGDLSASGFLDDPLTGLRALRDAELRVAIDDLAELRPLVPALPGLAGRADVTVQASGALPRPDLEGTIEVAGLAFEVPRQGVRVTGGRLDAGIDPTGRIDLDGELPFGDGILELEGGGRWSVDAPPELAVRAHGRSLKLADSPELFVVASPDVTASLGTDRLILRGRVRVEQAEIRTPSAGTVVRPSADVVLAGTGEEAESAMERGIDAEIRIELADENVRFVGFGMEAQLGGALEIVDRPGSPTLATGEIEVSGKYEAWGQELEIESGRIIYAGTPITNPALLIEAVREVDGKRVGVRVTGPVRQPEVEVFSDPVMESSRALSLLLLGRPLEDATSNESDQLATAALAMAVRGSGRFSGALGTQLGFSEFGLTVRDDLGGAAFSIGRQLSSRLYLQYSIGLADALDLITLRYRLGEHWSLETEIGEETRGAIRYEVETGRGGARRRRRDFSGTPARSRACASAPAPVRDPPP